MIYDVLKTKIYAMENIMKRNGTISGATLSKEIRENVCESHFPFFVHLANNFTVPPLKVIVL